MVPPFVSLLAALPPDVAGIPTWVLDGLSVGSLVSFIIIGLATSRLWTKGQVDKLVARYDSHMEKLIERYDKHLEDKMGIMQGRIDDAVRREGEWRDVATQWQQVATMLGEAIDPMQEQSATTLTIVQQMQALQQAERQRRGNPR